MNVQLVIFKEGKEMPYYNVCEICGANLDPGEKCTCQEDARAEAEQKEIKRRADAFIKLLNYGKKRGKSK